MLSPTIINTKSSTTQFTTSRLDNKSDASLTASLLSSELPPDSASIIVYISSEFIVSDFSHFTTVQFSDKTNSWSIYSTDRPRYLNSTEINLQSLYSGSSINAENKYTGLNENSLTTATSLTAFSVTIPTSVEVKTKESSSVSAISSESESASELTAVTATTTAISSLPSLSTINTVVDVTNQTINPYVIHTTSIASAVTNDVSNMYTTQFTFDSSSETLTTVTIQSPIGTENDSYDKTNDISANPPIGKKSVATSTIMRESFQYQTIKPTYSPTIYTTIDGSNVSVYSGLAANNEVNGNIEIGLIGFIMVLLV